MIQKSALQCACSALLGVCLMAVGPFSAIAADNDAASTPATSSTAKKKKADKPKSSKVKFLRSSEESHAERRARLKLECKGAVNAGACTGYTR
ncbi:MAG: hypothetical protein V4614_16920 [Pseudomonadota bacterium]